MASETKTLNTVEDLVALASRPYSNDARWELDDWPNYVWDDPHAGAAWDREEDELRQAVTARGDNWWAAPERDAWIQRKPAKRQEVIWKLRDGRWRSTEYQLSEDLGKQLDAVWTKKKKKYSQDRRVGTLTLAGICKRLGRTDVADRVKAAKKAEEEKAARNARNYARRNVAEAAKKLTDALNKAREAGVETLGVDGLIDIDLLYAKMNHDLETDDAA